MTLPRTRLILITGMSGSGKTTLTRFIEKFGYRVVTMGDVIRGIALERGLEPTSGNLGLIAEEVRREEGDAIVARRCIENLEVDRTRKVVVDGIRSLEEVEAFKEAFDVVLVAVHASPRTRFNRVHGRGRSDDSTGWEAFLKRDWRELGFGVGSSIALADHMVINEGSINDLKQASNELIGRLSTR